MNTLAAHQHSMRPVPHTTSGAGLAVIASLVLGLAGNPVGAEPRTIRSAVVGDAPTVPSLTSGFTGIVRVPVSMVFTHEGLRQLQRPLNRQIVRKSGEYMQLLTGRCLCEGIAYEIRGELGPIFNCHCSKCRRWHGAAFRTRATINAHQFAWLKGEDLLARYHSSEFVVKHFCKVCGSNLISTYDNDPNKIGIPLGGLEQAPSNRPEGHFWVGSKSPWYEITDGLPQYEAWPGSHDKVRETSRDT